MRQAKRSRSGRFWLGIEDSFVFAVQASDRSYEDQTGRYFDKKLGSGPRLGHQLGHGQLDLSLVMWIQSSGANGLLKFHTNRLPDNHDFSLISPPWTRLLYLALPLKQSCRRLSFNTGFTYPVKMMPLRNRILEISRFFWYFSGQLI